MAAGGVSARCSWVGAIEEMERWGGLWRDEGWAEIEAWCGLLLGSILRSIDYRCRLVLEHVLRDCEIVGLRARTRYVMLFHVMSWVLPAPTDTVPSAWYKALRPTT